MQKREVKAVFFDLDGVIIDSHDLWYFILNSTLAHYGLGKLPKEKFDKGFGNAVENDVNTIYKGRASIKEIKKMYELLFRKHIDKTATFEDSVPVLKIIIDKNLKIALISNSPRRIVEIILNRLKLKKYFDVVITMDEVKKGKPAPDSLLLALKKLKLKAKEVIFIGDTSNDINAGKNARIFTIGYKIRGNHKINRLKEILDIIKN